MTEPLEHLKQYGYAPGHYMNTCRCCGKTALDVDKRAISCRECAEKKHADALTTTSKGGA